MTDENTDTDGESIERVRRTDHGLSIQAKISRGSGTRDSEEYRVKAKGETSEEALRYFEEGIQEIETEYAERLRGMQPDADEDTGDGEEGA